MNVLGNEREHESQLDVVVVGDDAIGDYLHRLQAGQLTDIEQGVGVSRRPNLGKENPGENLLGKDEYPDENMPND
jgi:hypothetical protein